MRTISRRSFKVDDAELPATRHDQTESSYAAMVRVVARLALA